MKDSVSIEIGEILNPKQELFCRNYTQNYEFMANGTLSYADAYNVDLDVLDDEDGIYEFQEGESMTQREYKDLWDNDKMHHKVKRLKEKSTYQKAYDVCASNASRLLKNVKIQQRIITLSNEFMSDAVIDKRLKEIALKGEDKDSIQAIKEYNKLKQRIVDRKDIMSDGKPLQIMFDEAFAKKPKPNE